MGPGPASTSPALRFFDALTTAERTRWVRESCDTPTRQASTDPAQLTHPPVTSSRWFRGAGVDPEGQATPISQVGARLFLSGRPDVQASTRCVPFPWLRNQVLTYSYACTWHGEGCGEGRAAGRTSLSVARARDSASAGRTSNVIYTIAGVVAGWCMTIRLRAEEREPERHPPPAHTRSIRSERR